MNVPVRPLPGRTFAAPEPMRSLQAFERYHGLDVSSMTDSDLALEARFFAARAWPLPADCWQRQRLAMLNHEINRRRRGRGEADAGWSDIHGDLGQRRMAANWQGSPTAEW